MKAILKVKARNLEIAMDLQTQMQRYRHWERRRKKVRETVKPRPMAITKHSVKERARPKPMEKAMVIKTRLERAKQTD